MIKRIKLKRSGIKKADFFMSETVGLILAVAGIVMLLYLAFSLYGIFTANNKMQQAKSALDGINKLIEKLGDSGNTDYLVVGPLGWEIYSYPVDGLKPMSCGALSCLCICPSDTGTVADRTSNCQKKGICKVSQKEIELHGTISKNDDNKFKPGIYINGPIELSIMVFNDNVAIFPNKKEFEDSDLFYSFLNSEVEGETYRSQITELYSSLDNLELNFVDKSLGTKTPQSDSSKKLVSNIQSYFSDYNKMAYMHIIPYNKEVAVANIDGVYNLKIKIGKSTNGVEWVTQEDLISIPRFVLYGNKQDIIILFTDNTGYINSEGMGASLE